MPSPASQTFILPVAQWLAHSAYNPEVKVLSPISDELYPVIGQLDRDRAHS